MSQTINVSSLSQLYGALSKAVGGETILLAGGDYGSLKLNSYMGMDITFPSNVTIKSADASKPASFSSMDMRDTANLTLDGIKFDYTSASGQSLAQMNFRLTNCTDVTIRNSDFDGDTVKTVGTFDFGLATGIGLSVRGCTRVNLADNEFSGFLRGVAMGGGSGNVVSGNDIHSMRMDGMTFSAVQGVRIENNYLHDFARSTNGDEHSDMIQFWTTGTTKPSTDIIIRGNTLDIGTGDNTQSIFMRNERVDTGSAGKEMYYRNILIEDNIIYNGHLHGISVGETAGLTIRNNSVLHADGSHPDGLDGLVEIPRINVAPNSTGVAITGNATSGISGWTGQAGWSVSMNAFVQDQNPLAPGYYGDIFIASSLTGTDGTHKFIALPGGMLDRLGAGAEGTSYEKTTAHLDARFHVIEPEDNGAVRIFDAGVTSSKFSTLPAGTTFLWDFGDGTTAKGAVAAHTFATGGYYPVKLTVRLPDGTTDVQLSKIGVAGPQILKLGPSGDFLAYDHGAATVVDAGPAGTTTGIELGGASKAYVAREHLDELFVSNNFQFSLKLKADAAGSFGEVFRLHQSFVGSVTNMGEFKFDMYTTAGTKVTAVTKGMDINDLAQHSIDVKFDKGVLQIFVDGALGGSVPVAGTLGASGNYNLTFGNNWNQAYFHGDMKAFSIMVDADDFKPVTASHSGSPPVAQTPVPEPEAPIMVEPLHDAASKGHIVDPDDAGSLKGLRFAGDAEVATTAHGKAIVLDGQGDFVALGRMAAIADSDRIAFSVDFARDEADGATARVIRSPNTLGLTVSGDDLLVRVATQDEGFKLFTIKDLGLNDTDLHRAVVMVDAKTDRMQVVLDKEVVLDVKDTDFDFSGPDRGWFVGFHSKYFFDGSVTDFRLGDRFEFLDGQPHHTDGLQA